MLATDGRGEAVCAPSLRAFDLQPEIKQRLLRIILIFDIKI